ncbi:hypothetical protein ScalyP_jg6677 [Parmales sp. scaly parma]|nr:hypothetical protein ScalyP_jg6677 [Parmales sp. scaly parma]
MGPCQSSKIASLVDDTIHHTENARQSQRRNSYGVEPPPGVDKVTYEDTPKPSQEQIQQDKDNPDAIYTNLEVLVDTDSHEEKRFLRRTSLVSDDMPSDEFTEDPFSAETKLKMYKSTLKVKGEGTRRKKSANASLIMSNVKADYENPDGEIQKNLDQKKLAKKKNAEFSKANGSGNGKNGMSGGGTMPLLAMGYSRNIDDDDKEFEEVAEEFTVGGGGGESLSLANSKTHDTPMDDFDF